MTAYFCRLLPLLQPKRTIETEYAFHTNALAHAHIQPHLNHILFYACLLFRHLVLTLNEKFPYTNMLPHTVSNSCHITVANCVSISHPSIQVRWVGSSEKYISQFSRFDKEIDKYTTHCYKLFRSFSLDFSEYSSRTIENWLKKRRKDGRIIGCAV